MSKINWLHISDLYFGLEREIKNIKTIRERLLDYVKEKFREKIKFDYLFVTGDIFYGKKFYKNKLKKEQKQSIKDATDFFNKLISNMGIKRENIFIVPGNHDTNRKKGKKEKYIDKLRDNYNIGIRVFKEEKIQKYQTEFNDFCKGLKGINFCDKAHKFFEKDDADILMLNTSISSCKDEEKKTELLLGKYLFEEELKKIKDNTRNWENESRPLFILAHHSPDYFTDDDREIIRNEFEGKKDSVLYLCGHNHFADVDKISGLHVLLCGTDIEVEKVGNAIRKNQVNFLRGSFDTAFEETIVYFYKWCRRQWMENRDLRQNKRPHHAETFGDDNLKTKILRSKSESEATMRFYEFLKELCEKSKRRDSDKCVYFRQEMNSLMDIIEEEKPEWRFRYRFEDKFKDDTKKLRDLKNIVKMEYQNYREVDGIIRQEIKILTDKIDKKGSEEKFGILLYSKSMRVTTYLLSLSPDTKKECIIYICAGDARGKTKYKYKYKDGFDIAEELFDRNASDFSGFNDVQLIPDIRVHEIIKQNKIHAILFGAVALYYGATNYTHFMNTVGSGLIVDLANLAPQKIPYIVIAEQSKSFNLYPKPKSKPKSKPKYKNKEINELDYPNTDLIKHIKPEFEEFELVELKNIFHVISDQKKPWEDRKPIPKEAFELFYSELLKDRRKLSLDNETMPEKAETIIKACLPEDKTIEGDVISKLKNAGIVVPDIKLENGSIKLEYYKGIRIFNFIAILESLKKNEYGTDTKKKEELEKIAGILLSKCQKNQERIQKELYEQFKNSSNISPYPKSKLTNIIDLFFMCLDLKVNKQEILNEIDWVYERFLINAIVPFRDASTKNMILEYKDLYLGRFENYIKQKEAVKKRFDEKKLQDIVKDAKIIDIDFSSCVNYTTPYDDVISFRFHEKTAPYHPSYDNLMWNNDIPIKPGTENESIVATFIMRFLRFGGRKLLYRIIDPTHHPERFKYDNEIYYFREIPKIIKRYKVDKSLSKIIELSNEIENILKQNKGKRFFLIPYDDENVAPIIKKIAEGDTYSDVFPF